jgi:hypothetical protein
MIFINKEDISEVSFVSLLEKTKDFIHLEFSKNGLPKAISGVGFETIVYNEMVKASTNTNFHGYIEQTGVQTFPDIIARKLYGVEVKMTVGDKWVSTGNSVLETTRKESVETIYMFFGKFGKTFEAKYRKYQDCLCEVSVTHSPRYKIDMELADGSSIFDKIGVPYDIFRKEENSIKRLKEYYRKQLKSGEELWWIDATAEESSVSPIIQSFRLLDDSIKERYLNECMILFPEIFGNSTTKFERATAYLITNYNAISSNLRDNFTAGGREIITIDGQDKSISQIIYRLFLRAKNIEKTIKKIPTDKLSYYWNRDVKTNPLEIWQVLLSNYSKDAVMVFNKGLKEP